MYIGAHVSIAGGFDKCLDRIADMGGNCLMTFASSPRSLNTTVLSPEIIQKYIEKKQTLGIGPHFFHGVYLVNIASESKSYFKASLESLIFYQRLAGEIGGVGTIFHIGSHKGLGLSNTLSQIVQGINYVLDNSPKGIKLILENCAGQGGTVGEKFEELELIIGRIGDKSKIGVCLDTQHAFASGYKIDTILDKFDQTVGHKRLAVIHFNDSLTEFGSKKDRHANIGDGQIGLEEMKNFLNDPRLKDIPFILETPGDSNSGPRKQDIELLKSMVI